MVRDGQAKPSEDNHVLVWLSAAEEIQRLHRQSQAWAIQQLVGSMDGFSGAYRES